MIPQIAIIALDDGQRAIQLRIAAPLLADGLFLAGLLHRRHGARQRG
ncbi:MAG: hypothetical protein ACLUI3_02055 [Christensenellales bacterium]